ncbi:pentapeptide repeat-containing protein [Streptomyces chartreusis]|uniref:pentapeptide repeat-containing protein n=1 Tax=Streptomyces chartreusis TaxID=1969 RepID=UPI0033A07640
MRTSPPTWPHCAHGADPATDPVGCRGIRVPGYTACLAHLTDADRSTYLTSLAPGADIDHRGTLFTSFLLDQLLEALRDPTTGKPHFGEALFDGAQFSDNSKFDGAQFNGHASFDGARFNGTAEFPGAQFSEVAGFSGTHFNFHAWFSEAQFRGNAWFVGAQFRYAAFSKAQFRGLAEFGRAQFGSDAKFDGAQFHDNAGYNYAQFSRTAGFREAQFASHAGFSGTRFSGDAEFSAAKFRYAAFTKAQFRGFAGFPQVQCTGHALFDGAQFRGFAAFSNAQFSGSARFDDTQFRGDVLFKGVHFGETSMFGPVVCAGKVDLSRAAFGVPVILEIAAQEVICERIRWDSTATFRLRYAAVDLSHAVLSAPVAVAAHSAPFHGSYSAEPMDESLLTGPVAVRVLSVHGVDAAHLVLTDTDLSDCLFSGAFHLDQLRLEGRTAFAPPPTGWHRRGIWPARWTRRRTLAEEHHWRAHTALQPALPTDNTPPPTQWRPGPRLPDQELTPDPEDIAALYRQLRKAFEDGKNEPGAADFYYGECEMRRHDHMGTAKSERRLLWCYWLLSGYGLRASRAAGWLLAAMTATVLLLMGFGLPTHTPDPTTKGTFHGTEITLNTNTADPALRGGWSQRMTWTRAENATRVVVNSVVFRSSGQNLTTAGTYIEMASRLLEPTLLALAVLAVRGRIKR